MTKEKLQFAAVQVRFFYDEGGSADVEGEWDAVGGAKAIM